MRRWIAGVTLVLVPLLIVLPTHCAPVPSEDSDTLHLVELKNQIVAKCYPELGEYDIRLTPYEEEGFFFETSVRKPLKSPKKRIYLIKFNRELFQRNVPEHALIAIMAHEMGHIHDYVKMGTGDFVHLALNYLFSKKFRTAYERQTDLKALERGFGPWLIEYRQWLYTQLDSKKVEQRRTTYMTPEEIAEWGVANPTTPCLSAP